MSIKTTGKIFLTAGAFVAGVINVEGATATYSFDDYSLGASVALSQPSGGTGTIVANPAGSGWVAKVVCTDYNTSPQMHITLPEGVTLGDCTSLSYTTLMLSSDNSGLSTPNYNQRDVYVNGTRKFRDSNYPKLCEMGTWATHNIQMSEFTAPLTDAEKALSSFDMACGINKKGLTYYVGEITLRYTINRQAPRLQQTAAAETGQFRNILAEAGYSQADIDARTQALWQQLFYGSDDSERVYYPVGSDMAYIKDVNNNDVRTEGMSYGLMIAVQLDHKEEFDRLWRWCANKMQNAPGTEKEGYFNWTVKTDGSSPARTPASDGEEWIVTALYIAGNRWGNDGEIDYAREADWVLECCFNKPNTYGNPYSSYTNLFDAEEDQVVFVPYASAAKFTDPSYHVPAFYELWARECTHHNDYFRTLAAKSHEMFPKFAHPVTGLMPDYANFDGTAHTGDGDHSGFLYDAWRNTMNMAIDYTWFMPEDVDYVELIGRLHDFFHGKGVKSYHSVYTLDGENKNGNTDHSPGLVACNAAGALASERALAWDFVDDFWETAIPNGRYRYYDGLLYFMNHLLLAGQFQPYFASYSGIEGVESEPIEEKPGACADCGTEGAGPVEYYDLQGRRIEKPTAPGIYTKCQSSRSTKVVVR